jgi:hypothetical protein
MLFFNIFFIDMKKRTYLVLLFVSINSFSQKAKLEDLIPMQTNLKINLNGLKIGIEQKLYKNITGQFEVGIPIEGKAIILKPQIRMYRKLFNENFTYFGIAYLYKHQEKTYNDTLRQLDAEGHFVGPRYTKDFFISKYIHALTLNTGFISEETYFKQRIIFDFNIGVGIRYKRSNRYGIDSNEDLDLQEAYIIRPANYIDTHGAFKIYPELNLTFSIIIPLVK